MKKPNSLEKIKMTRRKDQVRDMLAFDKNHLWNVSKLRIISTPTSSEVEEFAT